MKIEVSKLREFKSIPFTEDYIINHNGEVISLKWGKCRVLKPWLNGRGYPSITIDKKSYTIHFIMAMVFLNRNNDSDLVVDHIDNDRTNNKLENLQLISQRENASKDVFNKTSKYTGVCWNKRAGKWYAQIRYNNETIYLGLFNCELKAAKAYNDKLMELC